MASRVPEFFDYKGKVAHSPSEYRPKMSLQDYLDAHPKIVPDGMPKPIVREKLSEASSSQSEKKGLIIKDTSKMNSIEWDKELSSIPQRSKRSK